MTPTSLIMFFASLVQLPPLAAQRGATAPPCGETAQIKRQLMLLLLNYFSLNLGERKTCVNKLFEFKFSF